MIGIGIGIGFAPQMVAGGSPVAATGQIVVNNGPATATAAQGSLTVSGPSNGTTLTVGNKTYTLVSGSPETDEIEIGGNDNATANNIKIQINADTADTLCTANRTGNILFLAANSAGVDGNSIPLSSDDPLALGVSSFNGGADADTLTVGTKTATFIDGASSGDNIQTGSIETVGDAIAQWINDNTANTLCTAVDNMDGIVALTANTPGTAGNSIPLSTSSPDISITPFANGSD